MINSEKFTKRLQKVIEYYGESASSFAEKIGVQRSSISHILSGRNKPSLEFVLKVLTAFPEVELYWLLNGKGTFPKQAPEENTPSPSPLQNITGDKTIAKPSIASQKKIERIVIFYSDGSFENFEK
ncbi:DNA-binding transcriptional regulator, XRE-family HTH domain [Hyunsoonleella jejuensis]|uniref:DNA-binding transcriptional regulator, XRE-family HTH domain n=1 Tax=Hyunsoonleella jejuensis TaxID=419940 RepID=A0A1H9G8H6_9FLAO|nr:helix-turn-helix transcriptional regulator [Hyunsoonleella jejuensis]SEQ46416.1 DNA-binding transcriptional regulator, XRE-family HTH domain [Hyunsoonleella jejuensis]